MKKLNHGMIRLAPLAVIAALLLILPSCARKMQFTRSTVVPSAEGNVKVKKDKNGNYQVDMKVMRLTEPQNLQPSRQSYVVWMETDASGTKNIGQLKTGSGLLSKVNKASLSTSTPFKPVRFFVTAENEPAVSYPSYQTVLTTSTFN